MSQVSAIGDWVKGPFACATVEGEIVKETYGSYSIEIKKIESTDPVPELLVPGTVQVLPKRVIDDFFIRLNDDQLSSMLDLANRLNQKEWAGEIHERLHKQ